MEKRELVCGMVHWAECSACNQTIHAHGDAVRIVTDGETRYYHEACAPHRTPCQSCEALMINGVYCHEHGCPDAWQDETRVCKWCGSSFRPEDRFQRFCDDGCAESYNS